MAHLILVHHGYLSIHHARNNSAPLITCIFFYSRDSLSSLSSHPLPQGLPTTPCFSSRESLSSLSSHSLPPLVPQEATTTSPTTTTSTTVLLCRENLQEPSSHGRNPALHGALLLLAYSSLRGGGAAALQACMHAWRASGSSANSITP